jgi:RNase P subunit RPR2
MRGGPAFSPPSERISSHLHSNSIYTALFLSTMGKEKEPKSSRRHACPQCDYKTGNVSSLRKHVRVVHEKRRDHACPQCDAAFGQAGTLRTHVRTVHEKRIDHACPQCD